MTRRLITADAVTTPDGTVGDAVLIDEGTIVEVGMSDGFDGAFAEERFPGAVIVPGLRDAHLHPVGYTASLVRPSLKEAADFDDVASIVAEAARSQPQGSAVTALRLDDETLAEGQLPDRHVLDRVVPDRPVLLVRYCGHVSVANSAALELAGIDASTPDPPGGSLDRDSAGNLTGVLRETGAEAVSAAIRPLAPPITPDDLVAASRALASTGLTEIGAMVAMDEGCWAGSGSELDVLLDAAPHLAIEMGVFVIARDPEGLEEAADRIRRVGGMVRFAGVKMFSDGSLGGHTAAMHDGFSDKPHERGTDRLDPAWAHHLAAAALRLDGRVAIHAIGDRANSGVLDLMQRLIAEGADPSHLRIEHASVLTPSDVARFGNLGVTASVQPAFMASETAWLEKRVGSERIRTTYAFRDLADAGTPLAGGSDSPVEPPHPLWGIAAARDRCGIVPEQALDAAEALALFTTGSASAVGTDAAMAKGAPASFTIVDRDPLVSTPDDVRQTHVLATWVRGTPVPIPEDVVAWQS